MTKNQKTHKKVTILIKKCVLPKIKIIRKMRITERNNSQKINKEVNVMALSNLSDWNNNEVSASCSSACGTSDNSDKATAACGSACGASDE